MNATLAQQAMGALQQRWLARLAANPAKVVLCEGSDPRVVVAASWLGAEAGIEPVLIGEPAHVARVANEEGVELGPSVQIVTAAEAAAIDTIASTFEQTIEARKIDGKTAAALRQDPLYLGAAALRSGFAAVCIGGSTRPSGDVIRAGLRMLGLAQARSAVTSSFLMVLATGQVMSFGDCAVMPDPDADQLAEVAIATAGTFAALTGETPNVAMLSFSTKGSASHSKVEKVQQATGIVSRRAPNLCVDGELQVDAALDISVGRAKAPGSPVAGKANVLIFPDLDSGNIGYKLTQRLAGARAIGPILQGLSASMNDLSRGCSAEDIFLLASASAYLAEDKRHSVAGDLMDIGRQSNLDMEDMDDMDHVNASLQPRIAG